MHFLNIMYVQLLALKMATGYKKVEFTDSFTIFTFLPSYIPYSREKARTRKPRLNPLFNCFIIV